MFRNYSGDTPVAAWLLFALLVSAVVIGLIAWKIYRENRLFITNKRVFQQVTNSLVSGSMHVIDLSSIEDTSFSQDGILPRMFHYGTFRLATVGDETSYTFKYSDISPEMMDYISGLVTEAKEALKEKTK